MSSDTATQSAVTGRRQRQKERCEAWKAKQNQRFIAEMDRQREERFANLSLYSTNTTMGVHQLPSVDVVKSFSDADCDCEVCLDIPNSTVTIPLPISTIPLQLTTEYFYGSMASIVENVDEICTFGQFNRTVQLQLLNQVYPTPQAAKSPAKTDAVGTSSASTTTSTDITAEKVELPKLIQSVINSAKSFEIPISKVPNGAFIRSQDVKEQPVKRIIMRPEILKASDLQCSPDIKRRYWSIFDYTDPDVESIVGSRVVGKGINFTPSDAAATASLLAHIPIDAHELWKIADERPHGSPEMYYLLYGPTVQFTDPQEYDIRTPPPDWCYLHYRLSSVTSQDVCLYKIFSGVEEQRIFDANFRRIMERSKVQKIFKDLRRIPLNKERSLFLKY